MQLSEKLRLARKRKKLTQTEISKHLNLTSQAYSKYENGDNTPTMDSLIILCNLLEVSANWLLGIEDNPKTLLSIEELKSQELIPLVDNLILDANVVKGTFIQYITKIHYLELEYELALIYRGTNIKNLNNGDILFINQKNITFESGMIYLLYSNQKIYIDKLNKYPKTNNENIKILGKVVGKTTKNIK
jgi:Predicted transcriptional regulators